MSNINLINEKNSKLDLSAVKDANGEMVILQPKGAKGSQRECHEDVLEHPHVVSFLNAKWLRYEEVSLKPIEAKHAPAPAPAPVPVVEPAAPVPPPSNEQAPKAPAEETTQPIVEDAPAPEAQVAEEAPSSDAAPAATSSEVVDVGEALSTSVTSGGKKKHRRD
jgi:type IV secretory pathway VirB10-like protein